MLVHLLKDTVQFHELNLLHLYGFLVVKVESRDGLYNSIIQFIPLLIGCEFSNPLTKIVLMGKHKGMI